MTTRLKKDFLKDNMNSLKVLVQAIGVFYYQRLVLLFDNQKVEKAVKIIRYVPQNEQIPSTLNKQYKQVSLNTKEIVFTIWLAAIREFPLFVVLAVPSTSQSCAN